MLLARIYEVISKDVQQSPQILSPSPIHHSFHDIYKTCVRNTYLFKVQSSRFVTTCPVGADRANSADSVAARIVSTKPLSCDPSAHCLLVQHGLFCRSLRTTLATASTIYSLLMLGSELTEVQTPSDIPVPIFGAPDVHETSGSSGYLCMNESFHPTNLSPSSDP